MMIRPSSSLLLTCMVLLLQQQVSKRLEIFILFAVLCNIHMKSLKENEHLQDHDAKKKYKFSKQPSFQRTLKQSKLQALKQWQQGIMVSPLHGLTHYYENIALNPNMSYRDKMKYEWKRLETFRQAPARLLESSIKLAKDGLYYIAEESICKCAFCNHHFDELGEDLTDQHRRLCPDCPLVLNRTLPTNISISNELPMAESTNLEPLNLSQRSFLWRSKVKHPGYTNFYLRLLSFENFPTLQHIIRKLSFVEAGFFYTGNADLVICFHCGIRMCKWEESDNPYVEHARFSPNCHYLKEKKGQHFIDSVQELVSKAEKECKKSSTGNDAVYRPKYKAYAVLPVRTATFNDAWPLGMSHEVLAKAGFFYAGYYDYVRCFCCGGGLRNWDEDDDPWVEHARWFPKCEYLNQQKGSTFVDTVQRRVMEADCDHFQLMKGLGGLTPEKMKNLMMLPEISNLKVMGISKHDIEAAVDKYLKQKGDFKFTTEDLVQHLPESIRLMKAPRESPFADAPHSDDKDQLLGVNQQRKDITMCTCCNKNRISMLFISCSHVITCAECGVKFDVCPKCNIKIQGRMKVYLG